ncbi:hypothetical protein [Pseudanabaena sp. UWO310]|uniref:hypothetical protein n=1 Tax=Pseudanabaena sp. UWO310 TaxID=2480795 RepID=UPI0011582B41|nr:hypothetical protein [Pseudanabaena sp. UWO310]TYQ29981.1 hypothetical protein PseudUWO310_11210 [Pseudanabaena sp. UWO310]
MTETETALALIKAKEEYEQIDLLHQEAEQKLDKARTAAASLLHSKRSMFLVVTLEGETYLLLTDDEFQDRFTDITRIEVIQIQ